MEMVISISGKVDGVKFLDTLKESVYNYLCGGS